MADNVNIIVQDTINDIVVNAAVIVETIDINVQAAVDEVQIIANPNNYVVNINRIIGEQVQSDWDQNDDQAPDYIKNKPSIPTLTSELTNDGEDGVNPFITAADVPASLLVALPFTTDHLTATNNAYVIGDVVWYLGNVYRCIANNDSILPTSTTYWTNLGAGNPLVAQPSDWNATSGNNQILNKPTIPTTLPPSGAAGGDLQGNYPNPTVHRVHGVDFQSGAPTVDDTWIYVSTPLGPQPFQWQHSKLKTSQVQNDSTVTGTNADDALEHLDSSKVPTTRTISTTAPLSGGGDLSANRTLSITQATTSTDGYLSSTDWNTFNNKQSADLFTRLSNGWEASTDYLSNVFNDGWSQRAGGTGAGITTSNFISGINKNGICIATTGTNSTGFAGPEFGSPNTNNGISIGIGGLVFEQLVMIPTLSTSNERFVVFEGLIGAANFTSPSNAAFFYYDEGGVLPNASPNWKCYTSNAGVRTLTNSGIVVNAGQWYKLRAIVNAAATSVSFYINGTLVATHVNNIPPTTVGYALETLIQKTVGTTARILYTDYSAISQTFTTPR